MSNNQYNHNQYPQYSGTSPWNPQAQAQWNPQVQAQVQWNPQTQTYWNPQTQTHVQAQPPASNQPQAQASQAYNYYYPQNFQSYEQYAQYYNQYYAAHYNQANQQAQNYANYTQQHQQAPGVPVNAYQQHTATLAQPPLPESNLQPPPPPSDHYPPGNVAQQHAVTYSKPAQTLPIYGQHQAPPAQPKPTSYNNYPPPNQAQPNPPAYNNYPPPPAQAQPNPPSYNKYPPTQAPPNPIGYNFSTQPKPVSYNNYPPPPSVAHPKPSGFVPKVNNFGQSNGAMNQLPNATNAPGRYHMSSAPNAFNKNRYTPATSLNPTLLDKFNSLPSPGGINQLKDKPKVNSDLKGLDRPSISNFVSSHGSSKSLNGLSISDSFPEGLKNWIKMIYTKYPQAKDSEQAHEELTTIIDKCVSKNLVWSMNWDLRPVPRTIKNLFREATSEPKKNQKKKREASSEIELETSVDGEEAEKRNVRLRRFKSEIETALPESNSEVATKPSFNASDVIDWDELTVVGTCTTLEKKYFRLTSAPEPSTVRPLTILEKAVEFILAKWESDKNYYYICDQFQSIRQDLTVQRIKNKFTVYVYETFSRIAIDNGDVGEFNKCQAQLKVLYGYGLEGNELEFLAYRILYFLHIRNTQEINKTLAILTDAQRQNTWIQHALEVRASLNTSNYVKFFKLYATTPNHGKKLIDLFLERERLKAMMIISNGFRVTLPLVYLKTHLGFETVDDLKEFCNSCSLTFTNPQDPENPLKDTSGLDLKFQCKEALPSVKKAYEKYSKVDIKGQL